MIFQDRAEAGRKLASRLAKDPEIKRSKKKCVILSLVRGGAPVGHEVVKRLRYPHVPLIVKKIGAPYQEELAIGAVCAGEVFLHKNLIKRLRLSKKEIKNQVTKAQEKEKSYLKRFRVGKIELENKVAVIVDDGIATGASVFAGCKCLKAKGAAKVFLAVPVAPTDFDPDDTSMFNGKDGCFDKVFILNKDPYFYAVGQFYKKFPQITDDEAMDYFK